MTFKLKSSVNTLLKTSVLFSTIALSSVSFSSTASADVQEAPSTVNATYVTPSTERILLANEKISSLFTRNQQQDYVLQRIAQNTYWVQKNYYSTLFYVGEKGVLLFDPVYGGGDSLKKAISEITHLPVSAIVYSHNHADHIGDITTFTKDNPSIALIASQATYDQQRQLQSKLPTPTKIVSWPNGEFKFEGLTVQFHGFENAAHSKDHGVWLLKEEHVAHLPDLINPDQPPFWAFAGSETFLHYEENIKQLAKLDWTFFNGGHGNVGSQKDVQFYRAFLADLKTAVGTAMGSVAWGTGIDPTKVNAHTPYLPAWLSAVSKQATEALRPKYGQYYGFEAATLRNAEMVALTLFDYQ